MNVYPRKMVKVLPRRWRVFCYLTYRLPLVIFSVLFGIYDWSWWYLVAIIGGINIAAWQDMVSDLVTRLARPAYNVMLVKSKYTEKVQRGA